MTSRWMGAAVSLCLALSAFAAQATDNIRVFGPDSFRQIVADHAGQPFVIVVWSLDCDYCGPSFKALAEAQRRSKMTVVTITTDPAEDPGVMTNVRGKIQSTGLAAQVWAFGGERVEQLRYAIDPKWRGEMPRSYWYDGKGDTTAYSGVITQEVITRIASKAR